LLLTCNTYYVIIIFVIERRYIKLAKKSIVSSIRLNEDDYLKLKALKEEHNLSWTRFIAYVNRLVEKDMKK